MAKNPILSVINSSDFVGEWERTPGGQKKDFYLNENANFVNHKRKLENQLSNIKISKNEFSDITYAKLILKPSALAKSHRPTSSLFKKELAPVVGAGDIGELYVELTPTSIDKLSAKIEQAEIEVKTKMDKGGKLVPSPTTLRSEVGAIDDILPYTKSDKRKFSLNDAISWLAKPYTGGSYLVELFENPPLKQDWDTLSTWKRGLFQSFEKGLLEIGDGLVANKLLSKENDIPTLVIRIEKSKNRPLLQFSSRYVPGQYYENQPEIDLNVDRHRKLIGFLDRHPLVRKVKLPPIFKSSAPGAALSSNIPGKSFTIRPSDPSKRYPQIAVIDGGISSYFSKWVDASYGFLFAEDRDERHGSFIAGLLLAGRELNGTTICPEDDGCKMIDIDIVPNESTFLNYYPNPLELFNELEIAVKQLKAGTGVRIFNFSLNTDEHVSSNEYSYSAKILDKIAEENDVIFVISAGNTDKFDVRNEWSDDPVESLSILASAKNDLLKNPAESGRNLSVSALNPPNLEGTVPFAPANYSCRGPGLRTGLKPDLAHIGGAGPGQKGSAHGLLSLNPSGVIIDSCGTSYACPQIAKTLACLQNSIEGDVSRETLIALAVHSAKIPAPLMDKRLTKISKHLVGFGIPQSSENILEDDPHSITLIFANRVIAGQKLSFEFSWPQSLTKMGKCYGDVRLTLVATPPFSYKFGAEYVRINLDAHLRQQQRKGGYLGRLNSIYTPENNTNSSYEQNLIKHSFKWSPVKVYERTLNGLGDTSNWKLEVEHLVRDGESFPPKGVPFTAVLTISDTDMKKPVYDEMRQSLVSIGVKLIDIKTAARVVSRI